MKITHLFQKKSRPIPADNHIESIAPWQKPYDQTASADDIFHCFRLILGRSPHREEWIGHVAQAGAPLDDVVRAYIGSLEFANRSNTLLKHQLNDRISLKKLNGFSLYIQEEDSAVSQSVKAD